MTRRLIKRNAHACTTIALAWLLLSLFALWDWRDANRHSGNPNAVINYGIWAFQLAFVLFALYFHRTETPREVLWFGETGGFASGFIRVIDLPVLLDQFAGIVPELTASRIDEIQMLTDKATVQEGASITIPITFRGRPEEITFFFESYEDDLVEVLISTHPDLAEEMSNTFIPLSEKISAQ